MARAAGEGDYACLVCGHRRGRPRLRKGALELWACGACGFVAQHPLPGPAELEAMYRDCDNYAESTLVAEPTFLERDRGVLAGLAAQGAEGPLLDVGCGGGILLRAALERGWRAAGVELSRPSAEGVRAGLGVQVYECALEDAPLEPGSFGVVTFSHSLEHLPDPVAALAAARRLLRPGGLVHVAVPNWRAGKRLAAGRRMAWIYPHHLSYFTSGSLERAAQRAGLEVLEGYSSTFLGVDYPFVLALWRRAGLDGALRRFLRRGERPLEDLLTDDVQVDCPPWRLRALLRWAHLMLALWPEPWLARLGRGEELRLTARNPGSIAESPGPLS